MISKRNIAANAMLLLVAGLSLAVYKYNTSYLVMDWNLADVGQTYISAVSALEGKVPYRDFNYQWGPYALYLNVLAFKILGIKISSVRFLLTGTVIAITYLTFLLGRRFLSPLHAFLSAFIVHITLMQNILVPHANIYCIATGLGSLLLVIEYCRTHRHALVFLAGLLCGISLGLKLSAGLFIIAGTVMGLLVADGRYEPSKNKSPGKLRVLSAPVLITTFFIINAIVLIRAHLSIKYFILFLAPILLSCFVALRLQGQFGEATASLGRGQSCLRKSLLWLAVGALAGSLPWVVFYLFAVGGAGFFPYLIGSAVEHSKHIFLPYPKMAETTIQLAGAGLCFGLAAWLAKSKGHIKYIWAVTLAFAGVCVWIFWAYCRSAGWFSMVELTDNITWFLSPVVAMAASCLVIMNVSAKKNSMRILATDAGIMIVILYQVFFFLVAYPHTEFTHLSWSYPTTIILLVFLLEKARVFVVENWPEATRRTLGQAAGAVLILSFPTLIILAKSSPLLHAFYRFSPDLTRCVSKEYVELTNERGGVYEYVESAQQIEAVDRFIQANTEKEEYLLEFPTTFFYYYSQRKNPSRWDYFYPGLNSGRQDEILRDLERARPRFAIIYDNPYGWMFTYGEIRKSYPKIANYIEREYASRQRIGYFKIMERKANGFE